MNAGRAKERAGLRAGLPISALPDLRGDGRARASRRYGEFASHATQREKEAELLFRGEQYREAIASYYKKEQRYPQSLEELLEDKRYPMPVRHLRRLYRDPSPGRRNGRWSRRPAAG